MAKQRIVLTGLVALTLGIGVGIGTIVQDRAGATVQTPPAQLTIPDPVQLSSVFRQVAVDVGPAVVHINTQATVSEAEASPFGGLEEFFPFFGPDAPNAPEAPEGRQARGQGSGFIVDAAGYIVTNNHVVDGADDITVILQDESEYKAVIIGVDEETDLAVIKIEADREFPIARLGNSDSMFVGDWVLALGSPFGYDNSLTAGIVSAIGRDGSTNFQRFIQTDAAINPGNSGGPLVNLAGEVIGINTAIITSTQSFAGIGFALPSNMAVDVYNQLTTSGRVTRGFIGIRFVTDEDLVEAFGLDSGVVVDEVTAGGPSDAAGMRARDVITSIDGEGVSNSDELLQVVASRPVGSTVPIVVVRGGEQVTLRVTIVDREQGLLLADGGEPPSFPRNDNDSEAIAPARLGVGVQPLSRQLRQQFGADGLDGVVVTSVEPSSPLADAGIRPGMVISEIVEGGQFHRTTTVDEFKSADSVLRLEPGTVIAIQLHIPSPTGDDVQSTIVPIRIP